MKLSEKGIIIRKVLENDLRGIYLSAQENPHLSAESFSAENLAFLFMSENSIILAAARKKTILGFIAGLTDGKNSFIHYLYVSERFRGSGIGSALIDKYSGIAKKSGAVLFFIAISENNKQLSDFCIKRDFAVHERRLTLVKKDN